MSSFLPYEASYAQQFDFSDAVFPRVLGELLELALLFLLLGFFNKI
ncbi:hypothetical protein KTE69_20615 [Burkholderia multivorans]|nr:hypothetical protein [Burkholderia multivorans]MBU9243316.1 hypothetical protein [Burkholderia multivorans]MBU9316041.1 hypothetical protein [Burkholderia multivorans]MBU9370751.1 hypothetical protein [Burkholderia multivorans]MCO7337056.1 hypothetical protein [Burkholderia multivorans]MCO7343741.1 hypothetical protein [Burkholderia multivorans]